VSTGCGITSEIEHESYILSCCRIALRREVGNQTFVLITCSAVLLPEDSAREHIQEFVKSAGPVVQYVNNMYRDKEIGTDW